MTVKSNIMTGPPLPPEVKKTAANVPAAIEPDFKARKSDVVEILETQLIEMQAKQVKALNMNYLLDKLYDTLQETTDKDALYFVRLGVEDMRSLLKKMLDAFDAKMVEIMKGEKIHEFEAGPEGRRAVIYYGKEKDETLTDDGLRTLRDMLKSAEPDVQLALLALPTSASAWKLARVKEIADTKGLERDEMIRTEYKDKVAVQYVPKYILEKAGQ